MYQPLRPCPACARHVRSIEPACPFCDAALVPDATDAPRVDGPRLSRSAMLLLGSAALMEGCPQPQVAAVYGAPPPVAVDAAPRTRRDAPAATVPRSPPDDPGSNAEVYGAPPPQQPSAADAGPSRTR